MAERACWVSSRSCRDVRVVVADDSVLFREGLARLLLEAGFEVVGQAANVDELVAVVRSQAPEVAVIDIRMPPTFTNEGLVAAAALRAQHPRLGVLVLSHYVETHHALELLGDDTGGVGYLLKDRVSDLGEFAAAVRNVGRGGSVVDPLVVSRLIERRAVASPLAALSTREREVLALMAEGRSNQAIGDVLNLNLRTVETHVRSIFSKLDLLATPDDHRRVLAVLRYLRT